MSKKVYYYTSHLAHHGIKGQKWGVENGPPYPLGSGDHNASERKAGWRSSLKKSSNRNNKKSSKSEEENSNKKKKFQLTDKQKKYIKIGVGVTAGILAVYGGYKLSQKIAGRNLMAGDIPDEIKNLISNTNNKPTEAGIMNAIQKTTTHINDPTYKNNCGPTGIANILSLKTGKQFDAKPTGGEQKNLGGILEECFKGVKVKDGFATTFGKSQEDAKAMLLRKFGNDGDCSGLVSVQWKNKEAGGHIFGWSIINGEVNFFDGQTGRNTFGTRVFWKMIDPNGALQYARLDNCEPIFDALEKYVDFT